MSYFVLAFGLGREPAEGGRKCLAPLPAEADYCASHRPPEPGAVPGGARHAA